MRTYNVKGLAGLSSIHVGESLKNLPDYLPSDGQAVIITDTNLEKYYRNDFPDLPVITIGTGEKIKTLSTVEILLRKLLDHDCDRTSFIIGIGGGIVTDIVGFTASVFLRGVDFGFVSTSLLSQVDASVGGKNGVNLDAYKNMVGVFNQPRFVICDLDMLQTLPQTEISNGFAEIVKHALIYDTDMFDYIQTHRKEALDLDRDVIFKLVADSVRIKSSVVERDEKEAGERRKLNFGHTIGHAIEKIERAGHGRAVSVGMAAAALFSAQQGLISPKDVDRIKQLLSGLNLPISSSLPAQEIIRAASKDKKKQGQDLYYVFLEQIGQARVKKIPYSEMNRFITDMFSPG